MNTNNREIYEQFASITGCKTNRKITHYLEACNYDLATAVDLYFAQGGMDALQDQEDVAMISDDDNDEDIECIQGPSSRINTRSAQNKVRVNQKNGHSTPPRNGYHDEEYVRAPIPSTRGTIVEGSYSQQYGARVNLGDSVFNQRDHRSIAIEQENQMRHSINIGNVVPAPSRGQYNDEQSHQSMLQNLFRPPTDITFVGSFEAAKEVAIEMQKWLLVNVQDYKEFACQTLNRDIWSNEGVKELVNTNFVFWQVQHDSVDGLRMKNYYKIKTYPTIFVLDPRTGEMTQNFTLKKQDPVTLCDLLTSYLDKFPDYFAHDRFLRGTPEVIESDLLGPGNVPEFAAEPECSKSAMFVEEPMDRSLRKRKGDINGHDVKKVKTENVDVLNDSTRMLSVVDADEWRQLISPGAEFCRIRLKLPDGRLETIEITNNSKLKALFVFIAGRNLSPKEHIFVLSFPRREYSVDEAEKSLAVLGFSKNEMVHVELR